MHNGRGIYRRTVALCRLELDLVGRGHRSLVQAVPESVNHSVYVQLPVGPEASLPEGPRLPVEVCGPRGVHRLRLENDLYLGAGSATVILSVPSGI